MYLRRFISVLATALSIGVCVFITYISSDVDQNTIAFNLIFLGIMLLMVLAAYSLGLSRLIHDCGSLKKATLALQKGNLPSEENGSDFFHNSFLNNCYTEYCHLLKSKPEAPCDIRNFINEEVLENHAHRGLLEIVPDILTSLGILGTFVGLVMGLRGFDPSGYEQMAGSITPLINGIKVAFITSIYGISLSLAFSFNLRSEFSNLTSVTDEFLDAYYLRVRPPYEVDSLSRLLDGQKSRDEMTKEMTEQLTTIFVEQMGKSFENVITPAYERMTAGINQVVDIFTTSQVQAMTQVCETVIQQMRTELKSDFAQLTTTISDLQKAQNSYSDFMDRSLARMQQTFVILQDNMSKMNQYNTQSLDALTLAQKETIQINKEQKETYQQYIRFMYQSIEKFSDVWEKNSRVLDRYAEEISKLGPVQSNLEIRQDLDRISSLLQDVRKRQVQTDRAIQAAASNEEVTEMLEETMNKIGELAEMMSTPSLFRSLRRK